MKKALVPGSVCVIKDRLYFIISVREQASTWSACFVIVDSKFKHVILTQNSVWINGTERTGDAGGRDLLTSVRGTRC